MSLVSISKVKRKSQREIRLEEYLAGFYDCLSIFEDGFREEAWAEDSKRRREGRPTLISETSKEPRIDALWSRIEKANEKIRAKDNEYRALRESRI
jgi:hypothetical protein